MRVPRLRVQLAAANAIAVVVLLVVVTVMLTTRSDDLRRAEAVSGAQRDAEVLSAQAAAHLDDPATLGNLTSPSRSRRTEIVSPHSARLAGGDLLGNRDIDAAVVSDLDDTGVRTERRTTTGDREAIGVDPIVVADELRGAAVVVEPMPVRRGWRQLYGLDLPAVIGLGIAAWLLGWWLAGRISRPLDQLTEQARALVLSGDALPAPPSRIPEIATLRAAMARLADRVSSDTEHRTRIDAHLRRLSHELRTPLTTIRLRVEGLPEADGAPTAVILDQLDRIERLGDELARLRSGPRETTAVDLARLATEAADRLRPLAAWAHVELRVAAAGECTVDGEASALADALVNVIENAVKFTPPGGLVAVRVAPTDDEVVVEVSDTGPGIAAHLSEALVHPSVRAVGLQQVPGSGQGLAIVAATVDRHGGTLELNNAPAGGALVRIRLPSAGTAGR